nr:P-loop NTPase fold protein [Periweissella fabalis]
MVLTLLRIYTTQSELKSTKKYNPNNNYQHIVLDGPTDIDELNRKVISDDLSNTIKEIDFADRVVIGITGPWGSGKSSVWEIAKHELDMKNIIIIDFDPWQMDAKEAILSNLLTAITTNKEINFNLGNSQKIVNAFMRYMLGKVKTPFNALFNVTDNKKVFDNFFDDLSKHLIQMDKHLIITIDNLDRISGDNAFMLVSTINSIGKLKNIIVVLLYDELEVERKFANLAVGQNYMDKLVNKKVLVPLADKDSQIELFTNKLIKKFKSKDVKYDTEEIAQFIAKVVEIGGTVRQFNNFVSNLPMNYLPKKDKDKYSKFYLLDLLVIEYIKTTNASAYSELEKNRYMFVDVDFEFSLKYLEGEQNLRDKEKIKYYDDFVKLFPKEFSLLTRIFPSVDYYLNRYSKSNVESLNTGFIEGAKSSKRDEVALSTKNRRIFSTKYIDWYFNYSATEDVDYVEYIKNIVSLDDLVNIRSDIEKIANSDNKTKLNVLSLIHEDYFSDIFVSKEKSINIANELIDQYDNFMHQYDYMYFGVSDNIAQIIAKILRKYDISTLELIINDRFNNYGSFPLLFSIKYYFDSILIMPQQNSMKACLNNKVETYITSNITGSDYLKAKMNLHGKEFKRGKFMGVLQFIYHESHEDWLKMYYSQYLAKDTVYNMLSDIFLPDKKQTYKLQTGIYESIDQEKVYNLLQIVNPNDAIELDLKKLFEEYYLNNKKSN